MNIENITKGCALTYSAVVGFSAGYFAYHAAADKAGEIVEESDSMLNALLIGAGHMAVSLAVGVGAFMLANKIMTE